MLTQSLIAPVALLWILSNLSVSFLEGGVANRIKQSSWYLTTSEQECNSYLLCLLCNTTINLSQNCICFIFFLKTDCYYWLTSSCQLTAIPTSSPAVLLPLVSLCCLSAFHLLTQSVLRCTCISLCAIVAIIQRMPLLQFAKAVLFSEHFHQGLGAQNPALYCIVQIVQENNDISWPKVNLNA